MLAIILMMLGTTTKKQLLTIKIMLGTTTMLEQLTIKMLLGTTMMLELLTIKMLLGIKMMLQLLTCHQGSCQLPSAFVDADTPLSPQALNDEFTIIEQISNQMYLMRE